MVSRRLLGIILVVTVFLILGYFSGIGSYFTLENIKSHQQIFANFVGDHYLLSIIFYISLYALLIACALPIIGPMTLLGGYLYGYWAILYAESACLLGSVISFLAIRYFLAHWLKGYQNERVESFNNSLKKYGSSYLLMLQFLSIIPLFVINLLAAITHVPFKTVCWTTIVGCLPMVVLLTMAGRQLSTLNSIGDIFSSKIIFILILLAALACMPMILRRFRKISI